MGDANKKHFIAIEGQFFLSKREWKEKASALLTSHPQYLDAEISSGAWKGYHFTAICYDQKGKLLRDKKDFISAKYPVWWVWPDQIAPLIMKRKNKEGA